jgi:large subunit ribosomal protein L17
MRHRVAGKKLSRTKEQRLALRRTLITDLFRYGHLQTTEAKIEAIRGEAEQMITSAKRAVASGDPLKAVNARRLAARTLTDPAIVKKLFDEIAPKYAERPGGYTRVYKLGRRLGDAAPIALLELLEE